MPELPEEAVEALMRRRVAETFGDQHVSLHGWSKFQRDRPADTALYRLGAEDDLQAAAPAIRKQEQERLREALWTALSPAQTGDFKIKLSAVRAALDTLEDS